MYATRSSFWTGPIAMSCQLVIIFFIFAFFTARALHLPPYIKACSRSDPNLNECAEKYGRAAIPHIVKGDKRFRIPNMSPLVLPQIDIESGPSLKMQFKNVKVFGLEKMELKQIRVDVKNQSASLILFSPRVELNCDYNIDGKILVLPITGVGPANFTFLDGTYAFSFNWKLSKRKDGKMYADVDTYKMEITTGRDYFYMTNLFNGNELLGNQVNKFLNENWKEVHEEVAPSVTEVVGQLCISIARAVYEKVPYDEILLP